MRKKILLSLTVTLFLLVLIGGVQASVVRSSSYVPLNTFGIWDSGTNIVNAISQRGLYTEYVSGVTDWDAYFSQNPRHTAEAPQSEWWGEENAGLTGTVIFYLGGPWTIDKIALWNEEYVGIKSFSVYTSTDNISFNLVASNLLPTDNPTDSSYYYADIFNLTPSTGRYVKLEIISTGDNSYNTVSMGEIAFSTSLNPVPEPTTLLLLGFGLAGIASIRRRFKE